MLTNTKSGLTDQSEKLGRNIHCQNRFKFPAIAHTDFPVRWPAKNGSSVGVKRENKALVLHYFQGA